MQCPLPHYYYCHAVIASAIMLVVSIFLGPTVGFIAGAGFYAVREVHDFLSPKGAERVSQGLPRFDWPGFIWPVGVTAALWVVITAFLAI